MTISSRLALCLLFAQPAFAQGLLPGQKPAAPAPTPAPGYLLIGNQVPESLTVTHETGLKRTLLSYKPAPDILVVGFFSADCPENQKLWSALSRIYHDYYGWHATFLAVSSKAGETREAVAEAMKKAKMDYTVVRDEDGQAAKLLHATVAPEIVVIDEWGYVRYRGGIKNIRDIFNSVIGHEPLNQEAEPKDVEGCPIP